MRNTRPRIPAAPAVAAMFLTVLMTGVAVCPTMANEPQVPAAANEDSTPGTAPTLPPEAEVAKHKTFDPAPELQVTPGGGLVVNAFIMDGPVRVEIRDRDTGRVVMSKEMDTMFPFEVSRHDLNLEPTRVVVRIYVKGALAHELNLLPEG